MPTALLALPLKSPALQSLFRKLMSMNMTKMSRDIPLSRYSSNENVANAKMTIQTNRLSPQITHQRYTKQILISTVTDFLTDHIYLFLSTLQINTKRKMKYYSIYKNRNHTIKIWIIIITNVQLTFYIQRVLKVKSSPKSKLPCSTKTILDNIIHWNTKN